MAEQRLSWDTTPRNYSYNNPRTSISRSSTSNPQRFSRESYREPRDFANLDEAAVSPPVSDRNDDARRGPSLEQGYSGNDRYSLQGSAYARPSMTGSRPRSSRHERNVSYRAGTPDDPYELTEAAAPPPVEEDEQQDRLEDEGREADDEASSEDTAPYQPRDPATYVLKDQPPRQTSKWLTELYTVSYLIFFSFWGTLARLGVQWLTFYPGAPLVTPVIWANFAGSFIMGFLSEDQALFRSKVPSSSTTNGTALNEQKHLSEFNATEDKAAHNKRKKTIPLYIGLATGFCGSFTSFSSFARDAFLGLSNNLPTPLNHPSPGNPGASIISTTVSRNGGYSFQAWLHIVLATLALSIGALLAGAQIALFLQHHTPRIHGSFVQRFLDPIVVFLAWGCWLGAVLLAILPPHQTWRGEVLFALVFAPLGCLLRFYLALKLNGLVPSFPLGTFTANILGTAILGMCFDIQHVGVGVTGRVGGGVVGCQVLQGVMDGFCGCLTTVSTWVAEINGLKRKHAWLYAFTSIVGSLALLVVVMGSVRWSVGWQSPVCSTGYTSKVGG